MSQEKTVLAVVPWITDFAAYDLWMQPLGLLRLSSELKALGIHVDFINCLDRYDSGLLQRLKRTKPKHEQKYGCGRFYKETIEKPAVLKGIKRFYFRYGLPLDLFEKKLEALPKLPDVILLSQSMTYWYPGTQLAASILKKYFPDSPIVLGGIYAILMPGHARCALPVDHVYDRSDFDGALELILEVLGLKSLKKKSYSFHDIPRIDYSFLTDKRSVVLETTQGCPYRCRYCSQHLIHKDFKRQEPKKVIDDILFYFREYSAKYFVFYDDALAYEKEKHFLPLLKGIEKLGLKDISFHIPNGLSVSEINDEVAELLKACQFKTLRLSLETSSPLRQKETGGKATNRQFEHAVKCLHKAGFTNWEIETYIIMGLPGQSLEEIKNDADYVFEKEAFPVLAAYSPTPGSFYFEKYFQNSLQEPLLQNNTIFSARSCEIDEEKVRLLRRAIKDKKIRRLNTLAKRLL
ncbi:MAG: radical SAM protein [Candidatus Aureabacteria bacterium]|nr:radical SAM protein [Candidatus Auribacterota bacterium]